MSLFIITITKFICSEIICASKDAAKESFDDQSEDQSDDKEGTDPDAKLIECFENLIRSPQFGDLVQEAKVKAEELSKKSKFENLGILFTT